ncbi:MAG: hypothetical protein LQ349_000562 [Xanthoria aureola]|nr:MAG: hypothetical protein LQ349_000562 [Xanthoria aureola]
MLVLVVLSYLLSLGASIAIPAASPPSSSDPSQSLTPGGVPNPWPFHRSITRDIFGSNVRLTLTVSGGPIIHPTRMEELISYGLVALDNSAVAAGGYFKDVGLPYIKWTLHQLTLNITDLTLRDPQPERAGGRLKFGELKSVFQGVGALMKKLEYDELNIDIWRTATRGFPRRLMKVKHLGVGTLRVTPNEPDSGRPH